ncbi:hypothetical protein [Sphingobacterium deserti]|uniref:DUF4142 domain-containing protein n=1 Tax=Sphingobacterium deserti TaxID=1229276 RepID=A0A0B8T345_9SPHI|nr:hypothetical protein [Sphingobacterium deserti]KGE15887.1 hypothetical protein DI53_0321 [Sphingobacterium deserti]
MKFKTLFVAGVCASALLASCNPQTAKENQLKYTHTSLADGDAFQFFQIVGAKVVYEADYAKYAQTAATSAKAKQLAAKAEEVYGAIIPGLDSLAILKQVDFPVKGAKPFAAPHENVHSAAHQNPVADSATTDLHAAAGHDHGAGYSDDGYTHHVQHEAAVIKEQLQRLTRNTDKDLRSFAEANVEKVNELFVMAGGKEDAHAHH